MSDHLPRWAPHSARTFNASAAVTGGQLVVVSTVGRVAPTAGPGPIEGVAARDAAIDQDVKVFRGGDNHLTATGAIAINTRVVAGAAGTVVAYDDVTHDAADVIGHTQEAIADGETGLVNLYH